MSGTVTLKPRLINNASPALPSTNYTTQNHGFNNLKFNSQYNPVSERAVSQIHQRMSSFTIDSQKYRDSSIYNKNLSIQIMKEQAFKLREMELRKKYEGMDLEKLKELLPNISNRSTYNIEEVYTRPLSPSALNKQSYLEIFNSRKESMRKHLNYINYTNTNYNVVSNNTIGAEGDIYQNYLTKRLDYDSQVPQYRDAQTNNFFSQNNQVIAQRILDPQKFDSIHQDRKLMRLQMKSHILKNIKKAKDQKPFSQSQTNSVLSVTNNSYYTANNKNQTNNINISNSNEKQIGSTTAVNDVGSGRATGNTGKGFNTKNFYKFLETSRPQSILLENKHANQYQKLDNHSLLMQPKQMQRQITNKGENKINNSYQNDKDDLITVVGKQNSIKENAYSEVNVDLNQNVLSNQKYMRKLAEKRKQMNSQQSTKFRLNNKNLSQLSRQNQIELNNSKSAREVSLQEKKQRLDEAASLSEYSNNNSVAFSKRWQNLESYIQTKKSKIAKQQALSHAQSIAGSHSQLDHESFSRVSLQSRSEAAQRLVDSRLRYRNKSMIERDKKENDEASLLQDRLVDQDLAGLKYHSRTRDNRKDFISGIKEEGDIEDLEEEDEQQNHKSFHSKVDSSSDITLHDLDTFKDEDDLIEDALDGEDDFARQVNNNNNTGYENNSNKNNMQKVKKLKSQLKEERRKRAELQKLLKRVQQQRK